MTNKERFDYLADKECECCYKYWANKTLENKTAWDNAKQDLIAFAKKTGLTN